MHMMQVTSIGCGHPISHILPLSKISGCGILLSSMVQSPVVANGKTIFHESGTFCD